MAAETGPAVLMEQVEQTTCDDGLPCEGRWQLLAPASSQCMLYGSDAGFGHRASFRQLGCRICGEMVGEENGSRFLLTLTKAQLSVGNACEGLVSQFWYPLQEDRVWFTDPVQELWCLAGGMLSAVGHRFLLSLTCAPLHSETNEIWLLTDLFIYFLMVCLAFLVSNEAFSPVKAFTTSPSPFDSSLSNKWWVHAAVFTSLRVLVFFLRYTRLSLLMKYA